MEAARATRWPAAGVSSWWWRGGGGGGGGGWRRRARLRRLRLDWRLRLPYHTDQIRHLIRWEGVVVPSAPSWSRGAGLDRGWRLQDFATLQQQIENPRAPASADLDGTWAANTGTWSPGGGTWASGSGTWAVGAAGGGGTWAAGAARGVPLAAALLLTLALLLRAADKCRAITLFKSAARRRQSAEWPTPNVLATSLSVRMSGEADEVVVGADSPPPYAAVAGPAGGAGGAGGAGAGKPRAEPPPPYSACYVAYTAPAHGDYTQHQVEHDPYNDRGIHADLTRPNDVTTTLGDHDCNFSSELTYNAPVESGNSPENNTDYNIRGDHNSLGDLNYTDLSHYDTPGEPDYVSGNSGCSIPNRVALENLQYNDDYNRSDDARRRSDANAVTIQMDRDLAPRERHLLV